MNSPAQRAIGVLRSPETVPQYPVTPLTGVETNWVQFTPWNIVLSPPPLVFLRQTSTPEALGSFHKAR
eukprot:1543736-Pyramimonas_sp.AAC.1